VRHAEDNAAARDLPLLIAPAADGGIGTATLFDAETGKGLARNLQLMSVERLEGDVVWSRYET
jgi:hypothetical protein